MKKRHSQRGRLTSQGEGLGTVTEAMVRKRAREIALINGRPKGQILDSDYAEARRELTTEQPLAPQETAADRLTEDQRWEAIPESRQRKAPTVPPSDEQTVAEKFVDEGVEDAEHDQMKEASKKMRKDEAEEEP